ncbi:MAG: TlyA family RNA methyltransferase [Bacillota bacterium]|nr:TlyA family RNA methyltransferase [Bacillota bacterium]
MKERLDLRLVREGCFPSRERARAAVMAGLVYVNGERVDKAGHFVEETAEIAIKGPDCPYVSRGGLKLEKALEVFGLDPKGAVAMDVGASTGGFTDCMLQKGAARVYAVDVGYGQLDYKLRNDSRVVNMEKVNFRYLDPASVPEAMDLVTIDVSFISLNLVFPVAAALMKEGGHLIALVKPQFEAGREQVGKGGIVRDAAVQQQVLEKVLDYGRRAGLAPCGLDFSPVKGAKGNVEFLLHLTKGPERSGEPAFQSPGEVAARAASAFRKEDS